MENHEKSKAELIMENYEKYKEYYVGHILTQPIEDQGALFLLYMIEMDPDMSIRDFLDLKTLLFLDTK